MSSDKTDCTYGNTSCQAQSSWVRSKGMFQVPFMWSFKTDVVKWPQHSIQALKRHTVRPLLYVRSPEGSSLNILKSTCIKVFVRHTDVIIDRIWSRMNCACSFWITVHPWAPLNCATHDRRSRIWKIKCKDDWKIDSRRFLLCGLISLNRF